MVIRNLFECEATGARPKTPKAMSTMNISGTINQREESVQSFQQCESIFSQFRRALVRTLYLALPAQSQFYSQPDAC
jgi:hypothetical protein